MKTEAVTLKWLGQSGFELKSGNITAYIDPYLSDYCKEHVRDRNHTRLITIPLKPESITDATLIICTHDHADHLDPYTISAIGKSSSEAVFIAPRAAREHLLSLGIVDSKILPSTIGRPLRVNGIVIHPIAAKHEDFEKDEELGFPYQGYVLEYGALTIYHAGDCVPYDGLVENLRHFQIDIALLPINGRDKVRREMGFKGNFTYKEACQIAVQIKAKIIIPMHYGMFALNTESVDKFVAYIKKTYPSQKYVVLKCGESNEHCVWPRNI